MMNDRNEKVSSPVMPEAERKARGARRTAAALIGVMFFALIGNLVYFTVCRKDQILSSPYNKRQDDQGRYVVRGRIETSDGAVIAETKTGEDGSETRVYPFKNEYAHIAGYMTHGKSGVESAWNYELLTSHNNIIDQVINGFLDKKNEGDTVVTTLDSKLQDAAYSALGDRRGAVCAMDAETGEILCWVSRPDFDPNTLEKEWADIVSDPDSSQLVNRVTQGRYPPGSVFKIVTALAYYREHGTFAGFEHNCSGETVVEEGKSIHCYGKTAHGEEDFEKAFANSCNTAFARIGLELGAKKLADTAESLLFNKDLPSFAVYRSPSFSLKTGDTEFDLVQTAFGQGKTLVTPYYMMLLSASIANEGLMMTPRVAGSVRSADGKVVRETKPEKYARIMTKDEADALSGLMRKVVTEGTGHGLMRDGYETYGKTGSAEYVRKDQSVGTHSWFTGFARYHDGRNVAIAVVVEDGGAGRTAAVPVAAKVFDIAYQTGKAG